MTNLPKKFHVFSERDFWKEYKKDCFRKDITPLSYPEYRDLITGLFLEIRNDILINKSPVSLPNGIGRLWLKKRKRKVTGNLSKILSVKDYIKFATSRKKTYKYSIVWDRKDSNIKNKIFYKFKTKENTVRKLNNLS